jgi:hypothetical protein
VCNKRKDVEKGFGNIKDICKKCTMQKCRVCQQKKDVTDYYKSNPTTCKECAVTLAANRRKVGIVSMHEKVEKILEKQEDILNKQQSYNKHITKQIAILQDLAEKVERMDKEMAKLTKKVRKITMDQ